MSRPDLFCCLCGADFSDWYDLNEDEQEQWLEKNPDINMSNLIEGCCPCCGFSYEDEDGDEDY